MLLLLCLACGWLLARRTLGLRAGPGQVVLALCLALVGPMTAVHLLVRLTALAATPALGLGALSLSLMALGRKSAPARTEHLPAGVVVVGLLMGLYVLWAHRVAPDGDDWIHAPLQRLLQDQAYPPRHPFFPGVTLGGHVGRDRTVAVLAEVTGLSTTQMAPLQASVCCGLTLCLWWLALAGRSGSPRAAWTGLAWLYLGVCVGWRGGLLDVWQNNNSLAFLYLALAFWLLWRVEREPNPATAALLALVVGGDGVVYELHAGLLVLVILSLAALSAPRPARRGGAGYLVLAVLLAAPLLRLGGGPFSNLGRGQDLAPGQAGQAQAVGLSLAHPLLSVQLADGDYARLSLGFAFPWLAAQRLVTPGAPRVGWLSWDLLKIHWLGTWLAPLTLLVLVRRRPRGWGAALGLWLLGFWAYLMPALIDFGPVFAYESLRWEFVAGLGFAGSLGVALGLNLGPRRPRLLLAGILAWLCLTPTVRVSLLPLLARRPAANPLQLTPEEAHRAGTLREVSRSEEIVLSDFSESGPAAIWGEAALVTVSGRVCCGHQAPFDEERVGTPYRMRAGARAFWASGDRAILDALGPTWLFLFDHPDFRPDLSRVEGLHRVEPGLYRVDPAATPPGPGPDLRLLSLAGELPPTLDPGVAYLMDLTHSRLTSPCRIRYRLSGQEWIPLTLRGETTRLALVAPHRRGNYRLEFDPAGPPLEVQVGPEENASP